MDGEQSDRPIPFRFWKNTETGSEPVRAWLLSLDDGARKKIGEDIRFIQEKRIFDRPYVGSLGDGLYEVRTSLQKREFRVLFSFLEGSMFALHGIAKKTMKTPPVDIALARKRKKALEQPVVKGHIR